MRDRARDTFSVELDMPSVSHELYEHEMVKTLEKTLLTTLTISSPSDIPRKEKPHWVPRYTKNIKNRQRRPIIVIVDKGDCRDTLTRSIVSYNLSCARLPAGFPIMKDNTIDLDRVALSTETVPRGELTGSLSVDSGIVCRGGRPHGC